MKFCSHGDHLSKITITYKCIRYPIFGMLPPNAIMYDHTIEFIDLQMIKLTEKIV